MNWLALETVAQISVARILNALPEGVLIAVFAWALLRVLRRQNSGTRFAVWFMALLTVAALPGLAGFGDGRTLMAAGMSSAMSWGNSRGSVRPAIAIPGRWAILVFFAWVLGACAAMLGLATGFWRLWRLRRTCTPIVAADLDPLVRKAVEAIGASVTISTSESVRVPAAIGFFKRTIVLPAWVLRELPPSDLNAILLHEFAHLRRWDDWTNLIQKIVRALFFFHPAVWWIEKRLSVEREMACDDAVLAETANPQGYASCLVSLLEKSLAHRLADKPWSMAHAAVDRAHEAALRLTRILDTKRPVATRVWKPALVMVGAFAVVCLALLAHAPRFVAVDRGPAADHANSAAISQPLAQSFRSSVRMAAVIPAALRTGESSSVGKTAKVAHAYVHAHDVAGHQLAPVPVVTTQFVAPPDRVVATSASAGLEIVPEFRTLVLVEATEYVTPNSSVWSVQVWQVTLVRTVRERLARAPVPKSI